ncbi:MAG: hypothetical protein AAFS13_01155 [Pseudomonadota bacterium]
MNNRIVALLIVVIAPLTAWALTAQASTETNSPHHAIQTAAAVEGDFVACDEIIVSDAAFELAKTAVAEKLWSPASAEFPVAASRVSKVDTCRVIVRSWVEAKNGFGHMVRTPYAVEMQKTVEDWSVLGARIGSPTYPESLQLAAAN